MVTDIRHCVIAEDVRWKIPWVFVITPNHSGYEWMNNPLKNKDCTRKLLIIIIYSQHLHLWQMNSRKQQTAGVCTCWWPSILLIWLQHCWQKWTIINKSEREHQLHWSMCQLNHIAQLNNYNDRDVLQLNLEEPQDWIADFKGMWFYHMWRWVIRNVVESNEEKPKRTSKHVQVFLYNGI